jgi:hypothetical protein
MLPEPLCNAIAFYARDAFLSASYNSKLTSLKTNFPTGIVLNVKLVGLFSKRTGLQLWHTSAFKRTFKHNK